MKNQIEQLTNTWKNFGQSEPYWSVLTSKKYKTDSIEKNLQDFFTTGKHQIDALEKILNNHNSSFKDKVCLDFGCGVGRLTKNVFPLCSEVFGVDISESHLALAKQNVPEATFYLIDKNNKFPELSKRPDIIFSLITLQHNRPELIKYYSSILLDILNPGGIALLHIPYKIKNYINYNDNVNRMEMHYILKKEFISLALKNHCSVESVIETNHCGEGINDCIYVVRKK